MNIHLQQAQGHGRVLSKRAHAFTLIEVIIVVLIIAVIVSISTMSLSQSLQAMNLTNAGNKVTQLIEAARQRAMSSNVQTAVILITNIPGTSSASSASGRAFGIAERGPGGDWKAIREWEVLPDGIVVDLGAGAAEATFMTKSDEKLPASGSPPSYLDANSYSYASRVFLPSGGLLNSEEPARFQIVNGTVMGGGVAYTNKGDAGGPANYYRVSILGATGKTKVDRP